jgi:hypothetical protein
MKKLCFVEVYNLLNATIYEVLSAFHFCKKNSKQIVSKCVTVEIFGDDSNKSKCDSGGN